MRYYRIVKKDEESYIIQARWLCFKWKDIAERHSYERARETICLFLGAFPLSSWAEDKI